MPEVSAKCLCRQDNAHEDGIWAGAWTKSLRDGSEYIISGSIDDKVKIWSWYKEKLELKYTCTGHRLGVVSVDVNPQGTIAATCALDAQIKLWDIESGKLIRDIDATPVNAWSLAFSPDGQYLATGSFGGKVDLYNAETGQKRKNFGYTNKICFKCYL